MCLPGSAMLRVFVEVSDNYLWALQPFIYLFQIHWSELQPVVIFGYSRPRFHLPQNFEFFSIANTNYPADRWSNGMISFLKSVRDEHFVFLLNDYWLSRTVDCRGVLACYDYIRSKPEVLRIDLTDDRLYAGGMFDVEAWGNYDIIETPRDTPYQMSTQAAIWNRERMLEVLVPNKSAWEVEIHLTPLDEMRVLGTRQSPVRYANGMLKGKLDLKQINKIPQPHRNHILDMIPEEIKNK